MRKAPERGRKRKKRKEGKEPVGHALAVLMRHCFPGFWKRIDAMEDSRDPDRITYGLRHVLCLATLMFACRIPSR